MRGLLVGGHLEAASAARLRALVAVNLFVPLALCALVVPVMREQRSGHIVNVISSAGRLAVPGFAAYNATKSGLYTFSRTLRRELRGSGIRVSAFCPGSTASPMTRAMLAAGGSPGGEATNGVELPARGLLEALLHPRDLTVVSSRPFGQRAAMFLDRVFPRLLDRIWNERCDARYYELASHGGRAGPHATPSEVSVIMAVHPDVVRVIDGPLDIESCLVRGIAASATFRAWYPDGRMGSDPSLARPGNGAPLIDAAVAAVRAQVEQVRAAVAVVENPG